VWGEWEYSVFLEFFDLQRRLYRTPLVCEGYTQGLQGAPECLAGCLCEFDTQARQEIRRFDTEFSNLPKGGCHNFRGKVITEEPANSEVEYRSVKSVYFLLNIPELLLEFLKGALGEFLGSLEEMLPGAQRKG
jgi:hypothetical protein